MSHVKSLVAILGSLPTNVYVASTLKQAKEVLSREAFTLVFCDERLGGESYRELLHSMETNDNRLRLVVMLQTGEWEEYLEAVALGAFEAIRCPIEPSDVVKTLIQATQGQAQPKQSQAFQMTA
jgi:DNA-binding NtrC family response regulator